MDAAEYKHVVLGLIFLKYISDAFEAKLAKIAGTYHAWRGDPDAGDYADVPGFSRAAKLHDIRKHGHVLTPGRYVAPEAQKDDGEPFEKKMKHLVAELHVQLDEAGKLGSAIKSNLKGLGYGG